MDSRRFDALTRVLSHSQSRRRALTGLFGAALAASLGSQAEAGKRRRQKPPRLRGQGNNHCAHFCKATFPPGPARGKCTSDGAKGKGPCHECGPAAAPGHPDLCGRDCCPAALPRCCAGACQECCDAGDCGGGQVCQAGSCCTPPRPEDVCADHPCSCETVAVACGPPIDCGAFRCDTEETGLFCTGEPSDGILFCIPDGPGTGTAIVCPEV